MQCGPTGGLYPIFSFVLILKVFFNALKVVIRVFVNVMFLNFQNYYHRGQKKLKGM